LKKSIKYAGIAAATLLAVAPVAAPALASNVTTATTAKAAIGDAANITITYVEQDAQGNYIGQDGKTTHATSDTDNTQIANTVADAKRIGTPQTLKGTVGTTDKLEKNITSGYKLANPTTAVTDDGQAGTSVATFNAAFTTFTPAATTGNVNVGVTKDGSITSDFNDFTKAKNNYASQFKDVSAEDVLANQNDWSTISLGLSRAATAAQFNERNAGLLDNVANASDMDKLAGRNTEVYFTAKDAKGNTYDGQTGSIADLQKAVAESGKTPITITIHYRYTGFDSNTPTDWDTLTTFKITPSDTDDMTQLNAAYTDPMEVALNSKVVSTQYVNNSNVTLKDNNNHSVSTSDISLSNVYYHTYSAAMDAARVAGVKGAYGVGNGDVSTDDIDTSINGEFKTAGTYYQVVSYFANDNSSLAKFLNKFSDDPNGYAVYVNGKKASAGYDFTDASNADGTSQVISFVRAIKVSNNTSQWTTASIDGVVTTKNDKAYYTLNNDEGSQVKNRALAKNTAWKTDKVRTDQNGNKQYRVATGEWIDANDVTYGEQGTTDNTSALTDIKSVDGKVTLDNAGFTYFLYNKDGDQLKTRALSGNTAWKVINTAKDAEGNTYYRVATDEWVMQGNGVNFI